VRALLPHAERQTDRQTDRQVVGQTNSLILFQSNRVVLWCFKVAGYNKMYLGLQVKYGIFLPNFN